MGANSFKKEQLKSGEINYMGLIIMMMIRFITYNGPKESLKCRKNATFIVIIKFS